MVTIFESDPKDSSCEAGASEMDANQSEVLENCHATGASDLIEGLSIYSLQPIRCAAHSLQLAVKDYLNMCSKNAINKARALVKALRTPTYRFVKNIIY